MNKSTAIPSIRKVNRKLFGIFLMTLFIISAFIFLFTMQEHQNKTSLMSAAAVTYTLEIPEVLMRTMRQLTLPIPAPQYVFSIANLKVILFLFTAMCLFVIFLLLMTVRSVVKKHNRQVLLSVNNTTDNDTSPERKILLAEKIELETVTRREKAQSGKDEQANELLLLASQKIAKETRTIFWALPLKAGVLEQNSLLKYVINNKSKKNLFNTWRAIFNHETILTILACAKQARITQKTQHVEVTSLYGDVLALNVDYVSGGWCGTLRNISPLAATENENKQLQQQVSHVKRQQVIRDIEQSNKLSEMLVRTMLQSQSVSIGSGITSWQVYRQLTRIFDWCRQTKIRAQLQLPENEKILTSVNLRNELTGVVLNVLSEVQLQRNQVFLSYSAEAHENVSLDNRLFNRMIVAISRLLLVEQFNATLTLNVEAINFNENVHEQRVKFTFKVQTAQPCKKISSAIALLKVSTQEPLPDLIAYIQLLMKYQDVDDLQIDVTEQGYQLSFEVDLIKENKPQSADNTVNLKHLTVLVVSNDLGRELLLSRCFSGTQASVISCTSNEISTVISEYLDNHLLAEQSIDVVALDGKNYRDMYDGLSHHLENLPEDIRPKLFVLQNNYNAALHQQGLFNQALQPMCPNTLQKNIHQLLFSEQQTNLLISRDEFAAYRFIPTQVEILFAVKEPEKHQTLIRLLNWLGLHVQVVCQNVSMEKYWRSGRYLLLFTELDISPFVEFSAGKSIKRTIFTFEKAHLLKLSNEKGYVSKAVLSEEVLATVSELPILIKQLSPWLKSKKSIVPVVAKPESSLSGRMIEKLKDHSKAEPVNTNDDTREKNHTEEDDKAIMNLEQFANNQGSAELAAFMLTEYIQEVTLKFEVVEKAITYGDIRVNASGNNEKALEALASIINYSTILSAQDVRKKAQRLHSILLSQVKEELAEAELEIESRLQALKQSITQLIEFEVSL